MKHIDLPIKNIDNDKLNFLPFAQKDEITKKAKQSSLSVSKYVMLKVFGIN